MLRKYRGFTIIELLVVISIISLLISILLPSLAGARDRARYAKWAGYSHGLRTDTRMISYFNYEQQGTGYDLWNRAAGDPFLMASETVEPEDMNGKFGSVSGTNNFKPAPYGVDEIQGNADDPVRMPVWAEARWKGKMGLKTVGNASDPDVVRVPWNSLYGRMDKGNSFGCWLSSDRAGGIDGGQNSRVFEKGEGWYIRQLGAANGPMSVSTLPYNWPSNSSQYNAHTTAINNFKQGEWYFVMGTFEVTDGATGAGDLKCYANGKLQDTFAVPVKPKGDENEQNVWFHSDDSFGDGFDGMIDEFLVASAPWELQEIETMYKVGKPRIKK